MDFSELVDVITIAVLLVGGYLLRLFKQGLEAGVKASAERGAQLAIENANWPQRLSQELQKTRGTERQELRFEAYAALWANQRPLAIYDVGAFDPQAAEKLSGELSNWYFSKTGGLLLTKHVRDFYFALQDLLRAVSATPNWQAIRSSDAARDIFKRLLESERLDGALGTLEYLDRLDESGIDPEDWPGPATSLAKKWRHDVATIGSRWDRLNPSEQFAVLQQVASTLRTTLVNDVESRLR